MAETHDLNQHNERMTLMDIKERRVVLNLYSKDELIETIIAMELK